MKLPKRNNLIVSGGLLLLALVLLVTASALPKPLQCQFHAERWAGESGQRFAQVSVFLPEGTELTETDVMTFRQKAEEKLAQPESEDAAGTFCDAWSARGTMKIDGPKGSFDAVSYAVGGSYFDFHPLTLESGGYLTESDLMKDRVVLDTQLAWLLFGSTDVTGMTVTAGDLELYVAGVVTLENDRSTNAVRELTPTLYLPYEARSAMSGASAVCYETVLPEPVEDYAADLVDTDFSPKGTIVRNTGRFSFGSSLRLLGKMSLLATRTDAVVFPDWENAALRTEFLCTVLRLFGLVFLIFPAVILVIVLVRALKLGRRKLGYGVKKLWQRVLDRRDDRLVRRQARKMKEVK